MLSCKVDHRNVSAVKISAETKYELLRKMLQIRETESSLLNLYGTGRLAGTVHTSIGQEACAVGVVSQLDRSIDILYSSHRGHGYFLAYRGNIRGLIAEIVGRRGGVCGGLG